MTGTRPRHPEPTDPVAVAAELAAVGTRGAACADDVARLRAAALHDADGRTRAVAIAALVRVDPTHARAEWRHAIVDADPRVRRRAAELAPSHTTPDATIVRRLVAALDDRDPTVVDAAAWALGELGDVACTAGAVGALCTTAQEHRDPIAREAAVAALGALGHRDGLPAILSACEDAPAVRRRAVLALAPFSGPDVDAALARALGDRDWQVRQAAEDLGAAG